MHDATKPKDTKREGRVLPSLAEILETATYVVWPSNHQLELILDRYERLP